MVVVCESLFVLYVLSTTPRCRLFGWFADYVTAKDVGATLTAAAPDSDDPNVTLHSLPSLDAFVASAAVAARTGGGGGGGGEMSSPPCVAAACSSATQPRATARGARPPRIHVHSDGSPVAGVWTRTRRRSPQPCGSRSRKSSRATSCSTCSCSRRSSRSRPHRRLRKRHARMLQPLRAPWVRGRTLTARVGGRAQTADGGQATASILAAISTPMKPAIAAKVRVFFVCD